MSISHRLAVMRSSNTTNAGGRKLNEFSLEEMDNFLVLFGKKHRNKKFIYVWENDQQWIRHIVGRFEKSSMAEHHEFMAYINLKLERAELAQTPIPPLNKKTDSASKSKEDETSTWSDAEVIEADASQPQLAHLEKRLMILEQVMSKVCTFLDGQGFQSTGSQKLT